MSEEGTKDWERPWTTEEIVEHADNWNLACDAALLNTLKAFGDRILKKAEVVNDKIDNLNKNLSKVHLQVDLARNEFSSLRNTQFVECRVYEDDETLLPEKPEDEVVNTVPEEETIEDFREVVSLGLEILDEYYDKVNVTVSDSEGEDEDGPSYVFRRKDPYINRRLPLVIGSEEWHKKWHVGLEETDSENENSSEKLSDSGSEDNFSQNKDHSDVSSELSNLSGLNNSKVAAVSTAKMTQQEILTSASGSDTSAEPTPKSLSFAEQLAAKLGNVIREAEVPAEGPEVNRRPIQKKPSDFGALFSNEPPPFDDVKEKQAHGIFSGGKGLFDDEDEDDLWNPGKTVTSSKQFSASVKKIEESDRFDQGKGLFDDDSDEGIFASSKNYGSAQQNKQPYLQSNKPAVPVFDEEPPLFVEEISAKEKKKPAGAVSLFGKSDIFQGQSIGEILKQRKASSSEDSNEDEPKIVPNPETKSSVINVVSPVDEATNDNSQNKDSKKQTISPVPQRKSSLQKKKMLFDDDIFGDDLFSSTAKKSSSGLFENSTLFSDDEIFEASRLGKSEISENTSKSSIKSDPSEGLRRNDLLSPETPDAEYSFRKNSKSNISNLFDDSRNDEDNIFLSKDSKQTPKNEFGEKSNYETVNTKSKLNLFGDDLEDVDDLFSVKKDDRNDKKSFLFDNDVDDDFNLFKKNDNKSSRNVGKGGEDIKTEKASTKIGEFSERDQTSKSTKPKISLFDDDLDTMDDLFAQFSKDGKKENSKSEKSSELFSGASSSIATILTNTQDTNDEENNPVRENEKDGASEEEKLKPDEKPITAPKSVDSDSLKKPVISQKPDIPIPDSIEKPKDISSSLENPVETQKSITKSGSMEKNVLTPKIIKIDPVEKATMNKSVFKIGNSSHDSSAEEVKKLDSLTENEMIEAEVEIDEEKDSKSQKLPAQDNSESVPKISIIEEPEDIEENVDISTNTQADMGPPKIETEKYKNSPTILNVNFMDSIPPPDDDWDTYSDNTFDDIETGNDGFQSQPSSLFDSEPPSLFFDDTIANQKAPIDDRFNSGPSLSQKILPDISSSSSFVNDNRQAEDKTKYDLSIGENLDIKSDTKYNEDMVESESSTTPKVDHNSKNRVEEDEQKKSTPQIDSSKLIDNKFSLSGDSKSTQESRMVDKPKLPQKPKVKVEKDEHYSAIADKIQTKPPIHKVKPVTIDKSETSSLFVRPATDSVEKNLDSSFGDVLDKDETDFLFANAKHSDGDSMISENVISDKSWQKNVPSDNFEGNQFRTDESGGADSDDNMQSNISKITEKLQQISNKNEERTKPVVSVPRKLSHNLNINVGALLPGSALPKRDRLQSPDENEKLSKSLPASRFNLNEDLVAADPVPTVRISNVDTPTAREYKLEKSVSFDGGTDVEVLQSITKDRAKIPVKRRPSSRRARQKSLRDSITDFRLDDPIPNEAILSQSKEPVTDNKPAIEKVTQNHKSTIEPDEQKIIGKYEYSTNIPENVMKEINVLEDDFHNLFKTVKKDVKNVNTANIISSKNKELFENEKEKSFGESSTKQTVTVKIPHPGLFEDADNDLFENIMNVSDKKHEPIEAVTSEPQDETSKLASSHFDKKPMVTNEKITDDFLHKVENYSRSEIMYSGKPNAEKNSKLDNLFDSSDEDDIFKSTKVTVKKTESIKDFEHEDASSISVIGKIAGKTDNTSSKVASGKSKRDSLFDFSDDEDFLDNFTSGKNDGKTKKIDSGKTKTKSLFDDMDDDIFGTSSSTKNKTNQDVKPSVINKKPPKSTSLRKLENIEGVEDPLSALLK